MPVIGTPGSISGLGDLIMEVRDLIPDPVETPGEDGTAFSLASLLRFVNHACEDLCFKAPIIEDWYAVPSERGMDVYELPNLVVDIRQLWYDLWPCWRSPEYDAIFVTKITSRSYYFGPHTSHQIPKIHVWPAADRSASITTLTAGINEIVKVVPIASNSGLKAYGFIRIDDELIGYRTIDGTNLRQILRGQGGTIAASHANGAEVTECNIMMKVSRLPRPVTTINDLLEVPQGLFPVIETGVLAHVRLAEQEYQEAARLQREFDQAVEQLAMRGNKLRQGIQIKSGYDGPLLYGHRAKVILP